MARKKAADAAYTLKEQVQIQGKRVLLFQRCKTKKALHTWIKAFIGLDMPDCIVDDYGPDPSNSSPMDMIWEVYSKCLENNDLEFKKVLYYSARGGMKTLSAAILEVLSIVHMDRDVGHMAAIEKQSQICSQYVKGFLARPYLRDFVVGNNKEIIDFIRYVHRTNGHTYSTEEYEEFGEVDKLECDEIKRKVSIVICTMAGANGLHVPYFCIDEVDVVDDEAAYEESRFIPDSRDGWSPITVLISTRKFATGLVQEEIKRAEKTKMKIRHWNIIDVTERCKPERHRPNAPKLRMYIDQTNLAAAKPSEYDRMAPEQKVLFELKEDVMEGCAACPLLPMCRGNLATKQNSTSPLLKKIDDVIAQFADSSLAKAKAQLLCYLPSKEGLIYSQYDPKIHQLTPAQIARRLVIDVIPDDITKIDLLRLLKAKGFKFFAGLDWGFTHNFAVVLFVTDGFAAYVVHVIAAPGLDPSEKVVACRNQIAPFQPVVYPDTAEPDMIKMFRSSPAVGGAGLNLRDWNKGPGSIYDGIEMVRMVLKPAVGDPRLFFLKGDATVDYLANRVSEYSWKLRPDETVDTKPNDKDDDELTAMRYGIQNYFGPEGIGTKSAARRMAATEVLLPEEMEKMAEAELNRQILRNHLIQNGIGQEQLATDIQTAGGVRFII